jgi:hypothetical protein
VISRSTGLPVFVTLSVLAGCTGRTAEQQTAQPSPTICPAVAVAPSGFQVTERVEERYPDHIGIRITFRDDHGRRLHSFTGVPGEYGEGLPVAGSAHLVSGEDVSLIGEDQTWIIAWDTGGLCGAHALIGNGFSRKGFFKVLKASGVI